RYPLHAACAKGDAALVNDLIHAGHQVNETNFDLVQPLHEACFRGSIECVNGRNIDGATPLSDACSSGSVECVKMLLTNGADVNPQLLLSSPLHEAVLRGKWTVAI
ncbi:ASB13-like protein, partial [Mya arenaria]